MLGDVRVSGYGITAIRALSLSRRVIGRAPSEKVELLVLT